jgi:hypothetical protein
MDSPQLRHLSLAEEEKVVSLEEKPHQGQGSLLPLPDPGSHERLLAERKLLRKLDTRLLPTIVIIYMMNYIDVCSFFRLLQDL